MERIVSFRPGVTESRSAFEAMAKIYRYLCTEYGYEFKLLVSEDDSFSDDVIDVETVPASVSTSYLPRFPFFPRRIAYQRHLDPHFEDADLVLTTDPTVYPLGTLAIRRAKKVGTPVWADASATVNGDLPLWRLVRQPLERRALDRCDRVLVTVPKTVERFRDRQLYNEELANKFTVLGHPVDTDRFSPRPTDDRDSVDLITVSRLTPEKGLHYIFEALTPLLAERDDIRYRILGSGPMRGQLERLARERNIDDAVEFLGTVPHEQVPAMLNDHDIYLSHAVSNSVWEEFFGVANLEAMACELACVVSDSGGIPYVIRREETVEFVNQRDVIDLRRSVKRLLNDPNRRERLGRRARKYVEDTYALERIGRCYHEMVQEAVSE